MATINNQYVTLADVMSSAGVVPSSIVDLTSQMNPMLQDAPALPCNNGTTHETTVRTGISRTAWSKLYKGIPVSKGRLQSVSHGTGSVETAIELDKRVLDKIATLRQFAGMSNPVEKSEAIANAKMKSIQNEEVAASEGMSQEAARALIYESQAQNPDRITGLAQIFSSRSAENGSQIVNANRGSNSGSDNTSVYYVTWHEMTGHLIYPDGAGYHAGYEMMPLETSFNLDANRDKYNTYRREMRWHLGLAIRDWRYFVRVANIDTGTLDKGDLPDGLNNAPTTMPTRTPRNSTDLIDTLTDAYYLHRGRRIAKGKTCMYANTTVVKFLDFQARNTPKNLYLFLNQTGTNAQEVMSFRGIPIKESDAILNTEDTVS